MFLPAIPPVQYAARRQAAQGGRTKRILHVHATAEGKYQRTLRCHPRARPRGSTPTSAAGLTQSEEKTRTLVPAPPLHFYSETITKKRAGKHLNFYM